MKVAVGLSGGIDSSISAYLLQQKGYEVIGIYMKLLNSDHKKNLENIEIVSKKLGIKYYILDIEKEFKEEIYNYFISSYVNAITPNPCVKCNREIKFGRLFDFAKELGADFLATGHYAKTDRKFIYKADDKYKDQSYFLAKIKKDRIKDLIFPLQEYSKDTIKQIAVDIGLDFLATQKESQEICFVKDTYMKLLEEEGIEVNKKGNVLDINGNIVGHHKGYMNYTIGKRKGFFVNGAHKPHYVLEINKEDNTIVVAQKEFLGIKKVVVNNLNMFIDDKEFECEVKLRYRAHPTKAKVIIHNNEATIYLEEEVFGVATGQCGVFYKKDMLLGGGDIIKTSKEVR